MHSLWRIVTTLVVAGSCSAPPADFDGIEQAWSGDDGRTVVALGDSLLYLIRHDLHDVLDADHRVRIATARGVPIGDPIVRQWASELGALDPDVAVLALGTIDVASGLPFEQTVAGTEAVFAAFADACTVAVEVDYPALRPGEADPVNNLLRSYADVTVHPEFELGADNVHPSEQGERHLAAQIDAAVDLCR